MPTSLALRQRGTGDNRQKPRFLREDSGPGAARLAVEAHGAPFKAAFQGLGYVDTGDAVAACLKFKHFRAYHLLTLPPVAAYANGSSVGFDDFFRLPGQVAERGMFRTVEPHLDASAAARAQKKFLGDSIGIGVVVVQVFLNAGNQPVDLLIVIDFDQELNVGRVLPFRRIHQQKAQGAAAYE